MVSIRGANRIDAKKVKPHGRKNVQNRKCFGGRFKLHCFKIDLSNHFVVVWTLEVVGYKGTVHVHGVMSGCAYMLAIIRVAPSLQCGFIGFVFPHCFIGLGGNQSVVQLSINGKQNGNHLIQLQIIECNSIQRQLFCRIAHTLPQFAIIVPRVY